MQGRVIRASGHAPDRGNETGGERSSPPIAERCSVVAIRPGCMIAARNAAILVLAIGILAGKLVVRPDRAVVGRECRFAPRPSLLLRALGQLGAGEVARLGRLRGARVGLVTLAPALLLLLLFRHRRPPVSLGRADRRRSTRDERQLAGPRYSAPAGMEAG